ncbi:serine hydrolase [Pseudoxanthomonas taiwanensis]|jgi:Beta-lactamase class C and other penicillin binding proteins|uniref:Serine hydrolase n=1 Tax=Pseudoxanthomonas taiwanensis TaxID=176598 RepID=A0A921P0M9_9GAMM|nr:serine hydrolase [Pseudoxanthomonas taiwanensis]
MPRCTVAACLAAILSVLAAVPPARATDAPLPAHAARGEGRAGVARIDRERIDAVLRGLVESGQVVGVSALVWQDGREAYFGAFGHADREDGRPMRRDTLVQIYSMTKPVTGVALMQLYEQGRFGLDDPVARYLPEFAGVRVHAGTDANGQPILVAPQRPPTIRDLLRHTAGLATAESPGLPGERYRQAGLDRLDITLEEKVRRLAGVPLAYQPGTRWLYSDAVDVQARLVEVLSGLPFDRYLQRHVFGPLRMKDTGHVLRARDRARMAALYRRSDDGVMTRLPDEQALRPYREDSIRQGGWGLLSTLDDYMRFARMLLEGGGLDGVRLLRPETVRLMASDALPAGLQDRSWLPSKGQVGFGIDFAVRVAPPRDAQEASGEVGEFFWDGLANTLFWVDPANRIAAVLFAQWIPFGGVPLHKAFRDAVYAEDTSAAAPAR